ncbi:MAG: hypothetical protein C5B45_04770 [Chlamydiae bacterium]|nr:MAG: hypothetical protein C5B45_04770 [Chlamydiota bacterium]
MASCIKPQPSFPYPLNKPEGKQPTNSTNTDEKASAIADQVLSNSIWYTELPPASNRKPRVPAKLSPSMVDVISAALEKPQEKVRPIPPPRSGTTCLSPSMQQRDSKTDEKKEAFRPDLSAVIHAKDALKSTNKKIHPQPLPRSNTTHLSSVSNHSNVEKNPPLPPPQENKPKSEPIPASLSKKRVTFQEEMQAISSQNATEDPKTNALETSNRLTSSNGTEENSELRKALDLEMDRLNEMLKEFEEDPIVKIKSFN